MIGSNNFLPEDQQLALKLGKIGQSAGKAGNTMADRIWIGDEMEWHSQGSIPAKRVSVR